MTHVTVSRVKYEGCVRRFIPARHRRRKVWYDAMTASATPYHHIGWIDKGRAEVLAAARDTEHVLRRVHIGKNLSKDFEGDALQT
jgi:hypothetical protein